MQKDTSDVTWSHPPDDPALQVHLVDIWRVTLDLSNDSVNFLGSSLSVEESKRASRFHFQVDRDRFIVAHGCLRDILGRYLRCEPHRINIITGDYGKPALLSDAGFEFNLSHSGEYALIAIARGHRLGIDVERIRPEIELERMARRYFSAGEFSELMALPPDQRDVGFFNCWTRKEAYIKAQGLGLSLRLDSFDVSLTPSGSTILRATRPEPQEADHWTLLSINVAPGYAGALAVRGPGLEFRYWDWNARTSN